MSHVAEVQPPAASRRPPDSKRVWFGRLMVAVLGIDMVVLTATALPTLTGGHLGGTVLLLHMMASGVMVALVPATLWWSLAMARGRGLSSTFLWFVVFALATIGSVFVVMLPIASTPVMEKAVTIHGWVGYATAVLGLLACIAVWRRRRSTNATASPLHVSPKESAP